MSNFFYKNKVFSSFKLEREYAPVIMRRFKSFASQETLQAHH